MIKKAFTDEISDNQMIKRRLQMDYQIARWLKRVCSYLFFTTVSINKTEIVAFSMFCIILFRKIISPEYIYWSAEYNIWQCVNKRSCRWYNIHNERRPTNAQCSKRTRRGGTWILNSMKMKNMKDTTDNDTYIKIGKQWDCRLGTVRDEGFYS